MNDVYAVGMQRWIIAGVLALALMLGGGAFAYKTYKDYKGNRPSPVWVPMRINPETPSEKQAEIVKELKMNLCTPEILARVSKEFNLRTEWKLASDEQSVDELGKRIFVRTGNRDTPMGRVPTIDVGVEGKARDRELSGKIAMRLMDDVWKILGITPPARK